MKYFIIKFQNLIKKNIVNEIAKGLLYAYEETELTKNSLCLITNVKIEEETKNLFKTINTELEEDEQFNIFESKEFDNIKELKEHLNYFSNLFIKREFRISNAYFLEKDLISSRYKNKYDDEIKRLILGKYYKDQEFLNSLKVFIECNMNTSKASELLYLHRNTLINRLDKFASYTGYDIRNFLDAYILYDLL